MRLYNTLLVAAMTIEGLVGTTDAFDPDIHNARPHKGQIKVARKIRSLLNNQHQKSEIGQSWAVTRVQVPDFFSKPLFIIKRTRTHCDASLKFTVLATTLSSSPLS